MGHDDKLRPSLTPRTPPQNGEAPLRKPHPVVFLSVTNLVITRIPQETWRECQQSKVCVQRSKQVEVPDVLVT